MPTLVMMHGMTGTAEMMRPFAESILPEGWDLIIPEATFPHPNRGYTWWRYEQEDDPNKRHLSATELSDVDSSLLKLKHLLPDDQLVLHKSMKTATFRFHLCQLLHAHSD